HLKFPFGSQRRSLLRVAATFLHAFNSGFWFCWFFWFPVAPVPIQKPENQHFCGPLFSTRKFWFLFPTYIGNQQNQKCSRRRIRKPPQLWFPSSFVVPGFPEPESE